MMARTYQFVFAKRIICQAQNKHIPKMFLKPFDHVSQTVAALRPPSRKLVLADFIFTIPFLDLFNYITPFARGGGRDLFTRFKILISLSVDLFLHRGAGEVFVTRYPRGI